MKKIKLVSTAALMLAIVGGALAFKSNALHPIYCNDTSNHCTLRFDGYIEQGSGGTEADPCATSDFPDAHGLTSNATSTCPSTARLVSVSDTQ